MILLIIKWAIQATSLQFFFFLSFFCVNPSSSPLQCLFFLVLNTHHLLLPFSPRSPPSASSLLLSSVRSATSPPLLCPAPSSLPLSSSSDQYHHHHSIILSSSSPVSIFSVSQFSFCCCHCRWTATKDVKPSPTTASRDTSSLNSGKVVDLPITSNWSFFLRSRASLRTVSLSSFHRSQASSGLARGGSSVRFSFFINSGFVPKSNSEFLC